MTDEYTIRLNGDTESFVSEDEEKYRNRLNGPYYPLRKGEQLLSFSPGNLASYPIFDDVQVFELALLGPVDGPIESTEDDREAWADPIRMEILRRLRHKDWVWYISAYGDISDPENPNGYSRLEQHMHDAFPPSSGLAFIEFPSQPTTFSRVLRKKTFFEIPFPLIGDIGSIIWSHAFPSSWYSIEGYHLPPGSMNLLRKWGKAPLDEKLFRQVVDACSVLFYTFPDEHRHFHFLTNKWTMKDMEAMLDLPSLQDMADQIRAQLGK